MERRSQESEGIGRGVNQGSLREGRAAHPKKIVDGGFE